MALTIAFWSYEKKLNSTKAPDLDTFNNKFVFTMKDSCNILNPVIKIQKNDDGWNPQNLNYAHIQAFNRFYYVNDWTYNCGLWECSLSVDPLASWRTEILNSRQYILRSSTGYRGGIIDTMFPCSTNSVYATEAGADIFENDFKNGWYVVGILNGDVDVVGAVSYYCFTGENFRKFSNALLNDIDWAELNTEEISGELAKALINPFQYIVSCNYFPFYPPSDPTTLTGKLKFGWWEVNATCMRLGNIVATLETEIKIPKYDEAVNNDVVAINNYRDIAPYADYTLVFKPFGEFPLDTVKMCGQHKIYCTVNVDMITGMGELTVKGSDDLYYFAAYKQVGVPIKLGQITTDVLGVAEGVATAVGGGLSNALRFDFGGAISNVTSGIISAVQCATPSVTSNGVNGSMAHIGQPPHIFAQFREIVDEPVEIMGRPCCAFGTLENYTGFVMTSNANIKIPGMKHETEAINMALDGGVFIE